MASYFGKHIHISIFGQSHSQVIGVTVDGLPAGESVDLEGLQRFLHRRAPGWDTTATARKEGDIPRILCGLLEGETCGAPSSRTPIFGPRITMTYAISRAPHMQTLLPRSNMVAIRMCGAADTFLGGSQPPFVSPAASAPSSCPDAGLPLGPIFVLSHR